MHKIHILICIMSRNLSDVQNETWKAMHYLISSAFPPELCIIPPRQSHAETETDSSPFRCWFFKLCIPLKQFISKWLDPSFICDMCDASVHVSVYLKQMQISSLQMWLCHDELSFSLSVHNRKPKREKRLWQNLRKNVPVPEVNVMNWCLGTEHGGTIKE